MSKSNQRKRSMYELGKFEGPYYNRPRYPKSKDYMRGWNEETKYVQKLPCDYKEPLIRKYIFWFALTVTIYLGSQIL